MNGIVISESNSHSTQSYDGTTLTLPPQSELSVPSEQEIEAARSTLIEAGGSRTGYPNLDLKALNTAVESTRSLYQKLMALDPQHLTESMREVMQLHESVVNAARDLFIAKIDAAIESALPLVIAILRDMEPSQWTDDITAFVKLFLQILNERRKVSTTLGFASLQVKLTELANAVNELKKSAESTYNSQITQAATGIAGGLMEAAGGAVSLGIGVKGSNELATGRRQNQLADEVGSSTRQTEAHASGLADGSAKTDAMENIRISKQLEGDLRSMGIGNELVGSKSQNYSQFLMSAGRVFSTMTSSTGIVVAAGGQQDATEQQAQQKEHEANAEAAGELSNSQHQAVQWSEEDLKKLLALLKEILADANQAEKSLMPGTV